MRNNTGMTEWLRTNPLLGEEPLSTCSANNKTWLRSSDGWRNSHGWSTRIQETHYKLPEIFSRLAC